MLDVGQKVVCVNADFDADVKALYTALPVKDKVYVIRDLELGIGIGARRVPKVSLKLVGLVNPSGPAPASRERGFDSDRFAPLEPGKQAATRRGATPDLIGADAVPLGSIHSMYSL